MRGVALLILISMALLPASSVVSMGSPGSGKGYASPVLLPGAPLGLLFTVGGGGFYVSSSTVVSRSGGVFVTGEPIVGAAAAGGGVVLLLANGSLVYLDSSLSPVWSVETAWGPGLWVYESGLLARSGGIIVYRDPWDYPDYALIYGLDGSLLAALRAGAPASHGSRLLFAENYIVELLGTGSHSYSLRIYDYGGGVLYSDDSENSGPGFPVAAAEAGGSVVAFIYSEEGPVLRVLAYDGDAWWGEAEAPADCHGWGAAVASPGDGGVVKAVVVLRGSGHLYAVWLDIDVGVGVSVSGVEELPRPASRLYEAGDRIVYLDEAGRAVVVGLDGWNAYGLGGAMPGAELGVYRVGGSLLLITGRSASVLLNLSDGSPKIVARGVRLVAEGCYVSAPGRGVFRVSGGDLELVDPVVLGYALDPFDPSRVYRVARRLDGSSALQVLVDGEVVAEAPLGFQAGEAFIYRSTEAPRLYVVLRGDEGARLYIADPLTLSVLGEEDVDLYERYEFYEAGGRVVVAGFAESGWAWPVYVDRLYPSGFSSGLDPSGRFVYSIASDDRLIVAGYDGGVRTLGPKTLLGNWIGPGLLAYMYRGGGGGLRAALYDAEDGSVVSSEGVRDARLLLGRGVMAVLNYGDGVLRVFGSGGVKRVVAGVCDASTWLGGIYFSSQNGTVGMLDGWRWEAPGAAEWLPGGVFRVGGVFYAAPHPGPVEGGGLPVFLPYVEEAELYIGYLGGGDAGTGPDQRVCSPGYMRVNMTIRLHPLLGGMDASGARVRVTVWRNGVPESFEEAAGEGGVLVLEDLEGEAVLLEPEDGVPQIYPLAMADYSILRLDVDLGGGPFCTVRGYNYTHIEVYRGAVFAELLEPMIEPGEISDMFLGGFSFEGDAEVSGRITARCGGYEKNATIIPASPWASMKYKVEVGSPALIEVGGGGIEVNVSASAVVEVEARLRLRLHNLYGLGLDTVVGVYGYSRSSCNESGTYRVVVNSSIQPALSVAEIHVDGRAFYAIILDNMLAPADEVRVESVVIGGADHTGDVVSAVTARRDVLLADARPVRGCGASDILLFRVGLLVDAGSLDVDLDAPIDLTVSGSDGSLNYTVTLHTAPPFKVYEASGIHPADALQAILEGRSPGQQGGGGEGQGGGQHGGEPGGQAPPGGNETSTQQPETQTPTGGNESTQQPQTPTKGGEKHIPLIGAALAALAIAAGIIVLARRTRP